MNEDIIINAYNLQCHLFKKDDKKCSRNFKRILEKKTFAVIRANHHLESRELI